ncbi:MAG: NO-inducible flavohemoprotein [Nitrococcus sp.]|nr:NO-inducible flavohemoprotein [Nitrococcus sp.]
MSLSEKQTQLIKASIPVLAAHGELLIRHFYQIMFRDYPQIRALFNQTHQSDGAQQRALAGAILAYARHIEQPEALNGTVDLIVNKHVSLNILPEHYPIVGTSLLRAMAEVLGDAMTPELAESWEAAYWQLANLLIEREEAIYRAREDQPGGWRGLRAFRVVGKQPESEVITSFYLEPVDGGPVMDFIPGQYIGLEITIDGASMRRNYSLSDAPNGQYYRISVKREQWGRVSGYLHDRVALGDILNLYAPGGSFTLREGDHPIVLVTGGVGITPAIAMLNALAGSGRPVRFVHAAIKQRHHAFRGHVEQLRQSHDHIERCYLYDQAEHGDDANVYGQVNAEVLSQNLLPDSEVYFLGPVPFMREVLRLLRGFGVPQQRYHFEFFGPAQALE